jgi:hypothetical protein
MSRIVLGVIASLSIAAALFSQAKSHRSLTAPTYYIAANAEYRHAEQIWLRGTSNLPVGAVLVVDV